MIYLPKIYDDLRSNLEKIAAESPGWRVGDYQGIPYLISPPVSADRIIAGTVSWQSIVTNPEALT